MIINLFQTANLVFIEEITSIFAMKTGNFALNPGMNEAQLEAYTELIRRMASGLKIHDVNGVDGGIRIEGKKAYVMMFHTLLTLVRLVDGEVPDTLESGNFVITTDDMERSLSGIQEHFEGIMEDRPMLKKSVFMGINPFGSPDTMRNRE